MSHYMTLAERYKLEALYNVARMPVARIAQELGFTRQTIYKELKLGAYTHTFDYYERTRYSADKAQQRHQYAQTGKGRPEKIGREHEYAQYIERRICHDRYSPAAAIAAAKAEGYSFTICVSTLYSYIDKGLFLKLSNKQLWVKSRKKQTAERPERRTPHPKLPSISDRPESINQRREPGHWEMDLIIGKKGTDAVLLTMTERLSRRTLIFKLPDRKADTVRGVFDKLEVRSKDFQETYKTITTDNGSEFLQHDKLIRSRRGGQRFTVYYCHSYSAWEKGTVENHNRMIRRFFPKGTDFTKVSNKKIAAIQNWMNDYPRRILNWTTPNQVYYSFSSAAAQPA